MKISFIIVNYRSEQFLRRCISSIYKHVPDDLNEIIIVNNDPSSLKGFANDAKIRIFENHENKGFAKACNIGAKIALGKNLFFLNPDTEIQTSVENLTRALDMPTVGIAAPCLITPSGNIEPWSTGNEITPLGVIINNLANNKLTQPQNTKNFVDWTSGGAMAISRSFFMECGGFDENFFMYFEDVELCRRIRMQGKKIIISPDVKVLHYNGQSVTSKKQQKKQYYQSQDYYLKKQFGLTSAFVIKFLRNIRLLLKNTV